MNSNMIDDLIFANLICAACEQSLKAMPCASCAGTGHSYLLRGECYACKGTKKVMKCTNPECWVYQLGQEYDETAEAQEAPYRSIGVAP